MGLSHFLANGRAPITAYGHAFLDLGRIHELIIYNGMERWPMSNSFTCFPHGGGTSVVDYIMGSPASTSQITDFRIPLSPPRADHTYLFFQRLTSRATTRHTPTYTTYSDIHVDHELSSNYSTHLSSLLSHIDTIPSLDHRAALITSSL